MKFEEEIKQKKFKSSTHKVLLNIIFTANWLNTKFKDGFKEYGITQQQYNVLRILNGRYPMSANPNEIKEVMLDKNPDLTRLCDRMCANGLIKRKVDSDNRRKVNIMITTKGINLLKKIEPTIEKQETYFKYMSNSDKELLSELLDKFRG